MRVPTTEAEITPEWLRAALAGAACFAGASWEHATKTRIGEGYGLDGTLIRVQVPDGETPSVIVKMCKRASPTKEPNFYRAIAPRMPVRLAKCFGSAVNEAEERFVLLLEDLADAEQGDCTRGDSDVRLRNLVERVASYHATFWGGADPVVAGLERFTIDPKNVLADLPGFKRRFLERWSDDVDPRAGEMIDQLPARLAEAAEVLAAGIPTFLHCDLHLDNVMFVGDEPVILDWPDGHLGPSAVDLGRILMEGMTLTQRRERQRVLVAHYQDTLARQGVPPVPDDVFYRELSAYCVWLCTTTLHWGGKEDAAYEPPRVREIVRTLARNTVGAACDGWLREPA